jgi:hypothetical protein
MGRYIQYKRIANIFGPEDLEKQFKKLIEDGFEIVTYDEKILEKSADGKIERIVVTIIAGKLNEGVKQTLHD